MSNQHSWWETHAPDAVDAAAITALASLRSVVGHHPIALHVFPLHCGLSPRNVHSTSQPGGFPSTQSAADEKTVSVYLSSGTKVIVYSAAPPKVTRVTTLGRGAQAAPRLGLRAVLPAVLRAGSQNP